MDGNVIQSTARRSPMIDPFSNAQGGIMTNISKLIFGTAIAAVSIAHPALAQHASQNASFCSSQETSGSEPFSNRLSCSCCGAEFS
jgi:hypothetical protein